MAGVVTPGGFSPCAGTSNTSWLLLIQKTKVMFDEKNTPHSLIQAKVPNDLLEFLQDFYQEYSPASLKNLQNTLSKMMVGSQQFDYMSPIQRVNAMDDLNRLFCIITQLRKPLKTVTEVKPRPLT